MKSYLFKKVDNSALIVFRILFGLLLAAESIGAVFTGWVNKNLVSPKFTFNFIGFDFLQMIPSSIMPGYYIIMGIFGLLVAAGFYYRLSLGIFTIMWSVVYLLQKSAYNNHYYLLILLCLLMLVVPANRFFSFDEKTNRVKKSLSMPNWVNFIFIFQMFIVYTFASIAKIYPDWLDGSVVKIFFEGKKQYPIIGDLLQSPFIHQFVSYSGILFDLLIVPLMLIPFSRKIVFMMAIFFHLFNSIVFQIGIFPYLSLALLIFFFPADGIKKVFFKKRDFISGEDTVSSNNYKWYLAIGILYFLIQIALPLRHHFIKGNVFWTEEGHRMSWRMMLRTKQGNVKFIIKDKKTGSSETIRLSDYLRKKQINKLSTSPDMIWQFVQILKKEKEKEGKMVSVYCSSKANLNRKGWKPFVDPKKDLANVKWNYFGHNDWIQDF